MKRARLWRVSVLTSPEAEDAVTELLSRVFAQPAGSYTDLETGQTLVTSYLPQKPKEPQRNFTELQAGLSQLKRFGLSIDPGTFQLKPLPARDWAESWKRHFKPLDLGPRLLIRPSWSRRQPRRGQAVVVLDPGLTFGTGQHPTTLFCLQQVVRARDMSKAQSFLDLGTGSGILALAAARLGYRPTRGFDNDPESVRSAAANARANRLSRQVRFQLKDLNELPRRPERQYSLICANLLTPLLLGLQQRIVAMLAPDGLLVLAGILQREFPQIRGAYEAAGLKLVRSRSHAEWRSGAFSWPKR